MAIGTPTAIGTNTGGSGNVTLTTTGTAPSGSMVFVVVGWGSSLARTLDTVSDGTLTWTVDYTQAFAGAIAWRIAVASAQAPSGLASGATITGVFSDAIDGSLISGVYCTGLETSNAKDVQDGQGQASATAWDTTATTTTVNDTLVLGGCLHDGTTTNTPSGGASELADFQNGSTAWSMAVEYKILSSIGAASLTGDWAAGAADNVSAFVAYKGLTGGATQTLCPDADITTTGWTSTPLWSKLGTPADATVVTGTAA